MNKILMSIKNLSKIATSTSTKPFESIPGPRPLPFIGNIWRYLPFIGCYKIDTLLENAQYNHKHYGSIVREMITKKHTILHLFDPKDIETFFRQDGKYPHRRSHRALLKYRLEKPNLYLDGGLFPENGPSWHRQRNQFQLSLMSKSQISKNIEKIDTLSFKMLDWIESSAINGEIKNFETLVYKWALGNTLNVFLNLNIDQLDNDYVEETIKILHQTLSSIEKTEIQSDKWLTKPDKCPHFKLLANTQEFLYKLVSIQVDKFLANKAHEGQFSYLNEWLLKDKIDRKDVIAFLIDSLMAGLHTTSYTVVFMLYNISKDKSLLNNLRLEFKENLKNSAQLLTSADLDKLTLFRDCLKETLRLNPVSIGTGRLTTHKMLLNNYTIPKDLMVITQNQAISRDEKYYDEAGKFKPTRWANYRSCPRDQKPSPFITLPFGFGPRACIGKRLAEMQIKSLALRLFQHYDIEFQNDIAVKTTLIHTIDGNVSVKLKPVNN